MWKQTTTVLVLFSLTACSFDSRPLRAKNPSISKTRSLGTVCSKTDSASIKREDHHPLGPTGGWYGARDNLVDYSRTMKDVQNSLVMKNGCISGYVKFDKPGYLQARSYDDYLGDVYCGWSSEKLNIKPTKDPVFVSLGICAVGDGGLDQIHEVGWFAENKDEGILVFSTAHSATDTKISDADLFQTKQLGNEYRFNEDVAEAAICANLKKGNLEMARTIVKQSFSVLSSLKNSQDTKGNQIPARDLNRDAWAEMISFSLGLNLGTEDFEQDKKEMLSILSGDPKNRHTKCEIQEKMLPLYSWLNDQLLNKKTPLSFDKKDSTICSWNPQIAVDFLNGKEPQDEFVQDYYPHGEFWVGIKYYLDGKKQQAKTSFEKYLNTVKDPDRGFELAASANLLSKIQNKKTK